MSLDIEILDSEGNGNSAGVTQDKALKVTQTVPTGKASMDYGIAEAEAAHHNYVGKLLDPAGNSEMSVDAADPYIEYSVIAENTLIKTIDEIRIYHEGEKLGLTSNESRIYGNPGLLTNGIRFYAHQGGADIDIFPASIKKIADYYLVSDSIVNDVNAIDAQTDILMIRLALPRPVILIPGSLDRLTFALRDDMSTLGLMHVNYYGGQITVPT